MYYCIWKVLGQMWNRHKQDITLSLQNETIVNAFQCISRHPASDDVYTMALIFYAHSLYGRDARQREHIGRQLASMAIETGKKVRPIGSLSFGSLNGRSQMMQIEMSPPRPPPHSYSIVIHSTGRLTDETIFP